jgi:predicted lipoprotein with Yx(FWY)xxD motif
MIVAGANGMTVYTFSRDMAGSGTSQCNGGCAATWPPLTVAAGAVPTGGSGVAGRIATITRSGGGGLQVTYNGKPLYFFANDKAPGDTNGNYPGWSLVKP